MPTYNVQGIPVEFPYDAYDCQIAYMESVVRALEDGTNALLESPTGTGKTLCLLCAALGWRRHKVQHITASRVSWEAQAEANVTNPVMGFPRIWYSSRTHSQLKQVVRELKRTTYKPFSVVLGSREHFCVHTSVARYQGARQNAQCKRARDENRCPFYSGLKKGRGSKVSTMCCDIEEIVASCKEAGICPFYKVREEAKDAELMLLPYDYLINPQTREALQLSLKDAILIFDEGHNIEKSCESVASHELSVEDIASSISEIQDAMGELNSADVTLMAESLGDMTPDILDRHLTLLMRQLLALEDSMYTTTLEPDANSGGALYKAPGTNILEILGRGSARGDGLGPKDLPRITEVIRKTIAVLTYTMDTTCSGGHHLDKFESFLVAVFKANQEELNQNYQVLLYEDTQEQQKRGTKRKAVGFATSTKPTNGAKPRVLCLWCFSCSVAMRELLRQGVRSIIVTSGTLSPIAGTLEAFGVPFPVVLENRHVINSSTQLWGGVLGTGPEKHILDASYEQRNEPGYLKDLGKTVASFASIVPDGILVAFHSYAQKETALRFWRQFKVWDEIAMHKPIFDEPKGNTEMKLALDNYTNAIERKPGNGGGAVLTAVCRGKLCEGVDFTDKQCRLVIVVGIPYPAKNDLRVIMKQNFLDSRGSQGDGRRWYNREAIRAVNQTVGRVIRHKNDYGAVLLCDGRYAKQGRLSMLASGLSSWLQPRISVPSSFEDAMEGCRNFFGTPKAPPVTVRNADPAAVRNAAPHTSSLGATVESPASGTVNLVGKQNGGKGPAPLGVLGLLFKKSKEGHSIPSALSKVSANISPANGVPSVRQPLTAPVVRSSPSSQNATNNTTTTPTSSSSKLNALSSSREAPVARQTGGGYVSKASVAWLRRAEGLVPRMLFECLEKEIAIMQSEASAVEEASRGRGNASDVSLMASMTRVAEFLLPEFSLDTDEEERSRALIVRDCALLVPRLLRPLWRQQVDDLLRSRGSGSFGVWSGLGSNAWGT